MSTIKKRNFGTEREPIEFTWDSHKIWENCKYERDEMNYVLGAYVLPRMEGTMWSNRYGIDHRFRGMLLDMRENEEQEDWMKYLIYILTAMRLLVVKTNITRLADVSEACKALTLRNMFEYLNSNRSFNRFCIITLADDYGILKNFLYMGSEFDNVHYSGWTPYDTEKLKPRQTKKGEA